MYYALHIAPMSETTILVKQTTRDQLKQLGHKGQSYDDVINELLKLKVMGAAKQ